MSSSLGDVPDGLDYYGEFAKIAPVLALLDELRTGLGIPDDRFAFLLPPDVMAGVTRIYGHGVIRSTDIGDPRLIVRVSE